MKTTAKIGVVLAAILCGRATTVSAAPIDLGAISDFVLLALNDGSLSINSATSIIGNVGLSNNVEVPSAQKVDTFTGSAYVHSGAATTNFNGSYTPATFAPSGGIQYGPGAVDTKLNQANTDAAALQAQLTSLYTGPVTNLGTASSNLNLTGGGSNNLYDVSWNYNSNTLTLNGGANDWFVFRSAGTGGGWSQSNMILNGVDANHVLFYFTSTDTGHDAITVNKDSSVFLGTIFAPLGAVEYHNPGTFNGRIIADTIVVHSDFNIQNLTTPPTPVPEPSTLSLMIVGVAGAWRRFSKRA